MSKHLPPNREPEELEFRWGNKLRLHVRMWSLQRLAFWLLGLVWAYLVVWPIVKALLNILTR